MKSSIFVTIILLLFGSSSMRAEDIIKFKIEGLQSEDALLAYYYGNSKFIKDTVHLDENGYGEISNSPAIPSGIYLLAFPSMKNRYFEFIMHPGSFSLSTDTMDFGGNMMVKNSKENDVFFADLAVITQEGKKSSELKQQYEQLDKESKEAKKIYDKLSEIDKKVVNSRKAIIKQYPDFFYTKVLKLMEEVELLEQQPDKSGKIDSSFAYKYLRQHYFDNVNWEDSSIIKTPVFHRKMMRFLSEYTYPDVDSINATCDFILKKSEANKEMFKYCLSALLNKYAKSKIMGHEGVYVYLLKNYYLNGKADWIDEEQLEKFRERYQALSFTQIGNVAPEIIMKDIDGNIQRLHDFTIKFDYTVLIFWNSGCGHCKTEMPILNDLYSDTLKDANVGIFAITTDKADETDNWKEFIRENNLSREWMHCHDPEGRNPARAIYDIQSTPMIFLINTEKIIKAKRIGINDIPMLVKHLK